MADTRQSLLKDCGCLSCMRSRDKLYCRKSEDADCRWMDADAEADGWRSRFCTCTLTPYPDCSYTICAAIRKSYAQVSCHLLRFPLFAPLRDRHPTGVVGATAVGGHWWDPIYPVRTEPDPILAVDDDRVRSLKPNSSGINYPFSFVYLKIQQHIDSASVELLAWQVIELELRHGHELLSGLVPTYTH